MTVNMNYSDFNPLLAGYTECDKNYTVGPKPRDCWVLHYIESGFGTYTVNNKTYSLSAGDVFVISPNTETLYKADDLIPWKYIWIDFDMKEEYTAAFDSPVIHCPGARRVFENIKSAEDMQNGRSAYLACCLWRFYSFLLERNEKKLDHIEIAISYIETNFKKNIRVCDIAANLHLDRTYFSYLFKQRTGISPLQYINRLRLQHSAELLLSQSLSVSDIATEAGYSDIYHFSKAFKRHFGCSPREYIKRISSKK